MHRASERKAAAKSKTERKISKVMSEWGAGQQHSGKNGKVVPKTRAGQKQALAIAYSMARKRKK